MSASTKNRSGRESDTPRYPVYKQGKTYARSTKTVSVTTTAAQGRDYQRVGARKGGYVVVTYRAEEARSRKARREIKKLVTR